MTSVALLALFAACMPLVQAHCSYLHGLVGYDKFDFLIKTDGVYTANDYNTGTTYYFDICEDIGTVKHCGTTPGFHDIAACRSGGNHTIPPKSAVIAYGGSQLIDPVTNGVQFSYMLAHSPNATRDKASFQIRVLCDPAAHVQPEKWAVTTCEAYDPADCVRVVSYSSELCKEEPVCAVENIDLSSLASAAVPYMYSEPSTNYVVSFSICESLNKFHFDCAKDTNAAVCGQTLDGGNTTVRAYYSTMDIKMLNDSQTWYVLVTYSGDNENTDLHIACNPAAPPLPTEWGAVFPPNKGDYMLFIAETSNEAVCRAVKEAEKGTIPSVTMEDVAKERTRRSSNNNNNNKKKKKKTGNKGTAVVPSK